MKKLFSAFTAVLLAFCFISCAPQELSDRSSKNEGSVSLSIKNTRTISPAEGISYKDVEKWTVTFQDITAKYDVITVENVNFNSSPQEIRLPLGTYNVTLNGTANNSTLGETAQPVPFYGEASVTVEGGTPVPISVFVAPKKSEGGTGYFNFTVTTSGFESYPPDYDTGSYFTVSLTPYGSENPDPFTWTPTEIISSSTTFESYLFSVSEPVSSGFYTLSIKYTWDVYVEGIPLTKTKEIYYPNHDFLVEIIDGLTTTGSADIIVSTEESKTYYATTGTSIGNGAFKSMPKNLDELLVDINRTTISEANIYMVDSLDIDALTITYPEIDVSKVNATGKTYKIYTKNKDSGSYEAPCYTITGAAVKGGEPTIYIDPSVRTVTLKNSQSSSGRAKIVALENPEFVLKDNTSVFIDLTDVQYTITDTTICMPDSTYNSYYAEHPCVTCVTKDNPNFQVVLERQLLTSYSVVTKSSDDEINKTKTTDFYIIPSYKAGLSVEGIPKYSLVATTKYGSVTADTPLYAGDTVTVTATPQGSFAEGTTFAWFINGEQRDCTAQSYKITFGDNAEASNTIICLVGYNGKYSTKSIDLNAQENTVVLYNNTSDTAKSALSYAILKESSILYPSELIASNGRTQIKDFCFDASNNMYALVYDGINYSINKYAYNNGYSTSGVTTYTCSDTGISTINNIETSDTGDLYAVIYAGDDNAGYADYIAKLTLQNLTEGTDGTIVFDYYASPISWTENGNSYNIYTFCIDGTNLYVIPYIYSSDYSTTEIKLVSCTVSDMQLTENKNASITLDYAENGQESITTVFSGYNDSLEYRDLCYINGKLYLLVRDVELSTSSYDSTLYSRGALCTFIVSDSGITAEKIDTGYQKTSSSFPYTGSYDQATDSYPTITRTAYIGDVDSKLFYGPVKFVARKQDELIIADDGFSIKVEDYTDYQGHTQATVSSKNSVVTYNLNTESLNFVSLDGEYFEEKYSGYFYSSGFYATNQ